MNNSKLIVDETHQISNFSTKNDEINWDLIANETLAGSNETESTTTPPSSTSPYYITMEIISLSLILVLLFYILLKPSQQGADVRQQRLERRLREKKLKSCPRRREKIVKSALYVKRVVRLDGVSLILGDIEDDGERSLGDDDGGGSSSWRSINDEDEDCSTCMICIEAFRVGDVVAWSRGLGKGEEGEEGADSIPCSHVFHEECIVPWLLNPKHDDCPSCRSCIVYDDYEEEEEEEEQQQQQQDNFVNNNNDGGGMSAGFVIVRGLVSRVRRASYSLIGQSIDLTDLDLDDDHDDDSHADDDDDDDDDEEQQRRNRFGPPPARGSLSRSSSLGDRIRQSVHGSLRRSFADFTTSASITHSEDDDDDDGGGGEDGSKTKNSMLPPLSPSTKKKKKALGRFSLPPKLPLRRVASAGPGGGGPSYRYHNINNHPDVEEGRASRRVRNRRQSRSSLLQRFEVPIEDSADGDDHDDDGDHDDNDHENVKMRSTLVANEKKFSALRPSGVPFRRSLSSNTNGSIEDYDEDDDEEQQRSRDVVWTPVSSSRVD